MQSFKTPASFVADQAGLSLTWSQISKDMFSRDAAHLILLYWNISVIVAVIVKTGEIFPATFPDRGPDQALRSARHFTGTEEVMFYSI